MPARPRVAKLSTCKFCRTEFYGSPGRWSCAVCTDDARNRSLRKYALKKLANLRAATAERRLAQTGANKQSAAL